MEMKVKLINSAFLPTLTYQCQTWTLNRDLERKVTTCEMRCLRTAVDKTRWDKIRNEEIRAMVGTSAIMNKIVQQRIRWFGHLMRMLPSQTALQAYNSRCSGNRARGRPQWQWMNGTSNVLSTYCMTLYQACGLSLNFNFPRHFTV